MDGFGAIEFFSKSSVGVTMASERMLFSAQTFVVVVFCLFLFVFRFDIFFLCYLHTHNVNV